MSTDRLSVAPVAVALGLEAAGRNRFAPCPACSADRLARGDRRGPVLLRGDDRWWCALCNVGGDARDLVGFHLHGRRVSGSEDWRAVAEWLGEEHVVSLPPARPPEPPKRPPWQEVARALRTATALPGAAAEFLERRNLPATVPARLLDPGFRADWWPVTWSGIWPLVVPAVDHQGAVRSLHARAIGPAQRKSTWPAQRDAAGLFFADPTHARLWLRGGRVPPSVLIVEGLTDYLRACAVLPGWAVLGLESGSVPGLAAAPWLPGQRVYVCTDADPHGDRYAAQLAAALPIAHTRVALPPGSDLCDALDAGAAIHELLDSRHAA